MTTAKPKADTPTLDPEPAQEPSQEVEVYTPGEAEVQRFLQYANQLETESPEQTVMEIVSRIFEAQSVDDVLRRQDVVGFKQLIMFPIRVRGVKWKRSEFDEGPSMYVLADIVRIDTGETMLATTGSMQIIAQLWQFGRLNAYPVDCVVGQADKPTAGGYYPMWLQPYTPVA